MDTTSSQEPAYVCANITPAQRLVSSSSRSSTDISQDSSDEFAVLGAGSSSSNGERDGTFDPFVGHRVSDSADQSSSDGNSNSRRTDAISDSTGATGQNLTDYEVDFSGPGGRFSIIAKGANPTPCNSLTMSTPEDTPPTRPPRTSDLMDIGAGIVEAEADVLSPSRTPPPHLASAYEQNLLLQDRIGGLNAQLVRALQTQELVQQRAERLKEIQERLQEELNETRRDQEGEKRSRREIEQERNRMNTEMETLRMEKQEQGERMGKISQELETLRLERQQQEERIQAMSKIYDEERTLWQKDMNDTIRVKQRCEERDGC